MAKHLGMSKFFGRLSHRSCNCSMRAVIVRLQIPSPFEWAGYFFRSAGARIYHLRTPANLHSFCATSTNVNYIFALIIKE